MTSAEWKEIPGYDGWYECSTAGEVRSWRTVGANGSTGPVRSATPKLLKQSPNRYRGGYLQVTFLDPDGKYRSKRVNRLVLATFEGEPEDETMHSCHRDGDVSNNSLSNLYWGTAKENCADKVRHGTQPTGTQVSHAKLTDIKVRAARDLFSTGAYTAMDLAEIFNVAPETAWKAATGKTWGHIQ